jgi:hypothetical protein
MLRSGTRITPHRRIRPDIVREINNGYGFTGSEFTVQGYLSCLDLAHILSN